MDLDRLGTMARWTRSLAVVALLGGAACTDDLTVNDLPHDRDYTTGASGPSVAYGSSGNEFLVAFSGDSTPGASNDSQVFGRRVSAAGALVGSPTPFITAVTEPRSTATAYASAHGNFLVATIDHPVTNVDEVVVQLVDSAGVPIGPDDQHVGGSVARELAVTYGAAADEYLVVWLDGAAQNSGTIQVRRIDAATGLALGAGASIVASPVSANGGVDVAYNATADEYLVVAAAQAPSGYRAVAVRLEGATAAPIGSVFPVGASANTASISPAVAYGAGPDRYLVVWSVDSDEQELGQFLDGSSGAEIGGDFQVTHAALGAYDPALAYDPTQDEFVLVTHIGSATSQGAAEEMAYQRIDATTGANTCGFEVVVSDRNPVTGLPNPVIPSFGQSTDVAVSPASGRFLATWPATTFLAYLPPPPPGGTYIYESDVQADLSSATAPCADL